MPDKWNTTSQWFCHIDRSLSLTVSPLCGDSSLQTAVAGYVDVTTCRQLVDFQFSHNSIATHGKLDHLSDWR